MKNYIKKIFLVLLVPVCFFSFVLGDTLVLKDGKVLQGKYMGGNESFVIFEVDGEKRSIPLDQISSITFIPRNASVETAPAPAGKVIIPEGSRVLVKLAQPVSTATHNEGSSFSGTLVTGLSVNNKIIVPPGTNVHGKVIESRGGRVVGGSKLILAFTDLEIKGQLVPIVTEQIGAEAGRGGTAKKVGAGALIGLAIDGGSGAGKGAAVGGALALLTGRQNHIQMPAGFQVEVSLKKPLTLE